MTHDPTKPAREFCVVKTKYVDLFNFGEVGDGKWIDATVRLYERMKDDCRPIDIIKLVDSAALIAANERITILETTLNKMISKSQKVCMHVRAKEIVGLTINIPILTSNIFELYSAQCDAEALTARKNDG